MDRPYGPIQAPSAIYAMMRGWRVYRAMEANTAAPLKIRKKENVILLKSIYRSFPPA
jgi:hypothetical protein